MAAFIFFCIIQLSVSAFSMLGGRPERIMGGMLLAATVLTISGAQLAVNDFEGRLATLMVDTTLFVAMVALAMKANRFWPIWVAGIHAASLPMHVVKALNDAFQPWVYALAAATPAFPILLILVIATTRHRARVQSLGADPAWNDHLDPGDFAPPMTTAQR